MYVSFSLLYLQFLPMGGKPKKGFLMYNDIEYGECVTWQK